MGSAAELLNDFWSSSVKRRKSLAYANQIKDTGITSTTTLSDQSEVVTLHYPGTRLRLVMDEHATKLGGVVAQLSPEPLHRFGVVPLLHVHAPAWHPRPLPPPSHAANFPFRFKALHSRIP